MKNNMNNKSLLMIIAIVLVGIFAIVGFQAYKSNQSPETIGESIDEIIDSAGEGAKEFKEEIKDEIDDHTDSR